MRRLHFKDLRQADQRSLSPEEWGEPATRGPSSTPWCPEGGSGIDNRNLERKRKSHTCTEVTRRVNRVTGVSRIRVGNGKQATTYTDEQSNNRKQDRSRLNPHKTRDNSLGVKLPYVEQTSHSSTYSCCGGPAPREIRVRNPQNGRG